MNTKPVSDQPEFTVLVVDDTPATLSLLSKRLEDQRLQVVVAEEGEEAIQRTRIVQPDLVLLDVMLPGMDGFETCRRLKADETTRDIPVIFMTALTDTQSKINGFEAGGVDFVTKPIQLEEVMARVQTHLALHGLRKQLEAQNARLRQEMAERQRAEAALGESEELHRLTLNSISDAVFVTDDAGTLQFVCPNAHLIFGDSCQKLRSQGNIAALLGNALVAPAELEQKGEVRNIEHEIQDESGRRRTVLVTVKRVSIRGGTRLYSCRDVTERKQAEDEIRRLNADLERRVEERTAALASVNRMMRILSDCNQCVVRATEESELLREICRIIVAVGGYPLAWVGFAEQDEARIVRPVAYQGCEQGYLDTACGSWSDTELGQGPTGRAIRSAKPSIVQDIQTEPGFVPWREDAARRGFGSAIALPLGGDDGVFGALTIFAAQPDAFHTQETELLTELAGDLAFGIRSLRAQTAQALAETARRASEDRYRALYEDNPSMYFTVDAEGTVLSVNPFGAEQLGYTVAELVGQPVLGVFHPDDKAAVAEQVANTLRTPNQIHHWEFRKLRKNGSVAWVREAARAVQGPDGKPVVLIVCEDVTDRRQAEENLRHLKEFNEGILQNMAEGLISVDGQEQVNFVNPALAGLLGATPQELLGRPWITLIPPEQQAIVAGGPDAPGRLAVGRYELELLRQDGTRAPVLASISLHSSGNPASGYLIVFTDLSVRKQLEGQLLQAQKMEAVGRLAGGVAHDFNNLLTVIVGFSDLLQEDLPPDDPRSQNLEEIQKAAHRAGDLTQQLLAFSRRQVLQPRVMDLNSTIENLKKMLGRLIREDIELQTVLGVPLPCIKADPGQIEQVLMNLAVNARDAMPAGGRLAIETRAVTLTASEVREHVDLAPGTYVLLAVSDTGTGIKKEVLPHIFEPFYTTKGEGHGTGLGLSTVYGIVKQSGSHIEVDSEPGRGTTFRIYLPAAVEPEPPVRTRSNVPGAASGSETILLVEDEDMVRKMTGRVLENSGYAVLAVRTGAEALALCQQHPAPIHLLLTDVVLPGGMSGWDLRARLLTLRPDIKVLCMSGYAYDATNQHTLERGIPFLQKPFKSAELTQKVREVLEGPVPAPD